ncbi:MAG: hypothetical protein JSV09_15915 [Thermoplasmata archaeon]|nr:MAG: hypothetical protein JSV09_15915 [Thermoplasmata archaeon]
MAQGIQGEVGNLNHQRVHIVAEHEKLLGLKIVAIIIIALGIVLFLGALYTVVTRSDAIIDNVRIFSLLDVMVAADVLAAVAGLFFFVGFGMWFLRGWAKSILLVLSMLSIVLYPLTGLLLISSVAENEWEVETSEIVSAIFTVLGIILSMFFLWYLSRPKVVLAFEAREMSLTKKKIRALEEKIELGRQQCNAGEITKAELSKLRSDCLAEERLLRAKIRHYEKVRLGRERKIKETALKKKEAKEEKLAKEEEKRSEKEEKKAERKAEKEEKKEAKEKKEEKTEEKEETKKKKDKEPKKDKAGQTDKKKRVKSASKKEPKEGEA